MYSVEDAAGVVRETLAHLEQEGLTEALFPALISAPSVDDDPDLAPVLGACGPRLLTRDGIAILPPERRFNCVRGGQVYRIFAAGRWTNGVNGYALAPSDWRPGLAVWGYSEGGSYQETEWGSVAEWLIEFVAPLRKFTAGAADPAQRAQLIDEWREKGASQWSSIEGDLGLPEPRPDWGPATRWHDSSIDQQGHLEREGAYVDGAAHGLFRFFDERGSLLQEGEYEYGWPQGRWTVHPAATVGLAEAAHVEYDQGVPVDWSVPPLAFDTVRLVREDGAPTTLAELARSSRAVVLIDCADQPVHALPERVVNEVAELPDLLVLGVHPNTASSGRIGERAVDVLADPTGGLARAYGLTPDKLHAVTYLTVEGGFRGAARREYARFKHLLADDE
ncbi:toxin-antitoxin system YwqK family antitoxin [Catenulispora sp. GAS73]|uniref:toxin-antitoxin system YwqK family antitoxin n=1 Tax=Catenulispora sp. GAS73 TaxID=3156269 RepID=UPI0035131E9A